MNTASNNCITIQELADRYRVSKPTVRKLLKCNGKIIRPFKLFKGNSTLRIPVQDVVAYEKKNNIFLPPLEKVEKVKKVS